LSRIDTNETLAYDVTLFLSNVNMLLDDVSEGQAVPKDLEELDNLRYPKLSVRPLSSWMILLLTPFFQKSCRFLEDIPFTGGRVPGFLDFERAPSLDAPPPPPPSPKRKKAKVAAEVSKLPPDDEDDENDEDEDDDDEGPANAGPTKYIPRPYAYFSSEFPFLSSQKSPDDQ
jgi:hypothetical protein